MFMVITKYLNRRCVTLPDGLRYEIVDVLKGQQDKVGWWRSFREEAHSYHNRVHELCSQLSRSRYHRPYLSLMIC